jgi:hypothetical protein
MNFLTNKNYFARFVCDADSRLEFSVIKRTAKFITINLYGREEKRCKISKDENGVEFIYPLGSYSMAPICRASQVA